MKEMNPDRKERTAEAESEILSLSFQNPNQRESF